MDILSDCILYDDPNYWEHLRQTAEQYVKGLKNLKINMVTHE